MSTSRAVAWIEAARPPTAEWSADDAAGSAIDSASTARGASAYGAALATRAISAALCARHPAWLDGPPDDAARVRQAISASPVAHLADDPARLLTVLLARAHAPLADVLAAEQTLRDATGSDRGAYAQFSRRLARPHTWAIARELGLAPQSTWCAAMPDADTDAAHTAVETDDHVEDEDQGPSLLACARCGAHHVTYTERQSRSADEPTTKRAACGTCGHRWVFE